VHQVLQYLNDGRTVVEDVPVPMVRRGHVLIRTAASVISPGTERMLLDFGKAGFVAKARQQPEKVRMVVDKVRTDGLLPTITAVRAQLGRPLALGYSSAGRVVEVGAGVDGFAVGDRVVSNGPHSEFVCVPENLCARVPDVVDDERACFAVIGAIALQGLRLVQPTLGETVVVTGLGLVGLLTVQLLRANGCRVLGIDFDADRAALARTFGAETCVPAVGEDPLAVARHLSGGRGVDAVIITAATQSDEPLHQAAQMCRKRGRIVLVGVTGLNLSRADFYEKELSFQVSCSYGPGRYDPEYEQKGHDYPLGFVRWTEQRNFEAVLGQMAAGTVDPRPMITDRYTIDRAGEAYSALAESRAIGIVLRYPVEDAERAMRNRQVPLRQSVLAARRGTQRPGISVIGAGNYSSQVLLPALRAAGADMRVLVSDRGVSSVIAGKAQGFAAAATDPAAALEDPGTQAVVVATRHDTHARYVIDALRRHKHVFVEKPLAITRAELDAIVAARDRAIADGFDPIIVTGFNRRFAPHTRRMRALLAATTEPKVFVMTVNAGAIPPEHWTQDPEVGGGRIIGEACHFVDLLRFLADSPIRRTTAVMIGEAPGIRVRNDKATILLEFGDGSFGHIHYLANGHRSLPKERLEVFCGGKVLQLDNFRRLRGHGWAGFPGLRLWRQDKGNSALVAAFVNAVARGGESPVPVAESIEATRATFDAMDSLREARAARRD
jgi:predicted dehydrogenase/threonine dehydrogenase-like Zn-dependent dehydrogenase